MILLTIAKVFVIDLAGLAGIWRALSFIGLGLVLVGIGYVYQRSGIARDETEGQVPGDRCRRGLRIEGLIANLRGGRCWTAMGRRCARADKSRFAYPTGLVSCYGAVMIRLLPLGRRLALLLRPYRCPQFPRRRNAVGLGVVHQ